jgi:hypothetical protein
MCGYENKLNNRVHEKIKCNNHEVRQWRALITWEAK